MYIKWSTYFHLSKPPQPLANHKISPPIPNSTLRKPIPPNFTRHTHPRSLAGPQRENRINRAVAERSPFWRPGRMIDGVINPLSSARERD